MANIEFTQGSEQHSSNWGKYFIKGLEKWQSREASSSSKHESYQEYCCIDIPEGEVFTIFEQSGNTRGTEVFHFQICIATNEKILTDSAAYGEGKIAGNFKLIAHGAGTTKAPRLMDWWIDGLKNQDPIAYAHHCAEYIGKRGYKEPPPMIAATVVIDPVFESLRPLVELYGSQAVAIALSKF